MSTVNEMAPLVDELELMLACVAHHAVMPPELVDVEALVVELLEDEVVVEELLAVLEEDAVAPPIPEEDAVAPPIPEEDAVAPPIPEEDAVAPPALMEPELVEVEFAAPLPCCLLLLPHAAVAIAPTMASVNPVQVARIAPPRWLATQGHDATSRLREEPRSNRLQHRSVE
jgi:hypothetical protein